MSRFTIEKIDRNSEKDYKKWVNFLKEANGATIFHHPDFLSYHKSRFYEYHLGVFKGEKLFGIMPLAISIENGEKIAKSPYGASYGGFIFQNILTYSNSKEIIMLLKVFLRENKIKTVIITPSLQIYYKSFSETLNFSMLEQDFKIINSDISSIVCLKEDDLEKRVFTSKLRNMVRKAEKMDIQTQFYSSIDDFWSLMDKTFNKHGVSPTHTKEEINYLTQKFPNDIYFNIAYLNGTPIAAIGVFNLNEKNIMSFYLCSDEQYKYTQAMSLIIYKTILKAKEDGFDYFDFGTSSVNMVGKENIFKFKESFGAVGSFRHTYYWKEEELE